MIVVNGLEERIKKALGSQSPKRISFVTLLSDVPNNLFKNVIQEGFSPNIEIYSTVSTKLKKRK